MKLSRAIRTAEAGVRVRYDAAAHIGSMDNSILLRGA
jgi:hypothetical protein